MHTHVVKRGLDIPIKGRATGAPEVLELPTTVAYSPTEFRGITPRMAVRPGDAVKRGSVLFADKLNPEMQFLSPAAGRLREVRRGHRRVITDVVVDVDGDGSVGFKQWELAALKTISRADASAGLLSGGLWPALRTRPLNRVPEPGSSPQSILIGALETGPLQPGAEVLLSADDADALQAGVRVLSAMTDGKVYLGLGRGGGRHAAFASVDGVEVHEFAGQHPVGDPTVQVNLIDPPRGAEKVWWIRAWDVVAIGRLFLEGAFPAERVYAAVGTRVKRPRFVRTLLGSPVAAICGEVHDGPSRWIRGSVLTGEWIDDARWAGFYSRAIHVLPDEAHKELFGWWSPQFSKWSFFRAFVAGFSKSSKEYDFKPGLWGGHRGMVPIGCYQKVVVTPDIAPEFLFKSLVARDLEESVELGLLDLSEEEAALCTYICPSKIEYDVLLRENLDVYEKETA